MMKSELRTTISYNHNISYFAKDLKKLERSRIVQQGLTLLFGSKTSQDKPLVKASAFQLIDGR